MSASTRVDVNFISVSNNIWGKYEGSDQAQACDPVKDGDKITPDRPCASSLKICDNSQVSLTNIEVVQSNECTVDINNHAVATLQGIFGSSQVGAGNQTFSVKGGSKAFIRGTLKGFGNRNCDILVDNWSDQSYEGSTVDLFGARHESGRKLKVIKRYGASTVVGDNFEIDVLRSLGLTAYWWIKWTVRKISGIKVGQKGPSWL